MAAKRRVERIWTKPLAMARRIDVVVFAGNAFSDMGTHSSARSEDGKDTYSHDSWPPLVFVRQIW